MLLIFPFSVSASLHQHCWCRFDRK